RGDGERGDGALEWRARYGIPRRHALDERAGDHQRGQGRQYRDGRPGRGRGDRLPGDRRFLVPYLIASYDQAYKMFNGAVGDRLDKQFQDKYKLKVLFFYDYGFRHFWNSKRPIAEPKDLRGLKMRVQQAKVFADTINGLGGVA